MSREPYESAGAQAILQQMNQVIKHRGPDDQGTWLAPTGMVGLAQVRLSIIDLSAGGHQPMWYVKQHGASNEKTKLHTSDAYCITFNGEIYNYQDIKEVLIQKGYTFSTKSDTEVILAAYLERGTACVNHFNGFWAFALYDQKQQQVFCSRDRLGVKPFYYYIDPTHFVFSSELKGILTHPHIAPRTSVHISSEAIDFYLTIGYIPAPRTIYTDIHKLEAGHSIVISLKETTLESCISRFYELPSYTPLADKASLVAEGRKVLEESVKIRMFTSDVPVGAFLSGGLDSSSVVAEMTKWVEKDKLNTFSIGFEGKYDETSYINIVKEAFGTRHHHSYFAEGDFEKILEDISYFYDEPFGDYSNFPSLFVSALAKQDVTVSLSGDGGDEIFGGYMMHQVAAQMEVLRKLPRVVRKLLYFLIPRTNNNLSPSSKLKEALRVSLIPEEEFYAEIGATTIYKPAIYQQRTREKLRYLLDKSGGNYVQAIIDFDLLYNTLADNFLVKVDRASMSQALEVRSPFLDVRWIERSRKVPTYRKVTWRATKILMREIIQDIVPQEIIGRGKKGFQPPIDKWILQSTYADALPEMLTHLCTHLPLDARWKVFYEEQVFPNNNSVYNTYKIKLLLLSKRYDMRLASKD